MSKRIIDLIDIVILFLFLIPIQLRFDNLQFALLSILLICKALTFSSIKINAISLSWIIYLLVSLCSIPLANNISLSWYPFFIQTLMILLFTLYSNGDTFYKYFKIAISLASILLISLGILTLINETSVYPCNRYFNHIGNYVTSFGLLLLPYIFFLSGTKLISKLFFSLVYLLVLLNLMLQSDARGALLITFLIIPVIIFVYLNFKSKYRYSFVSVSFLFLFLFFLVIIEPAIFSGFDMRWDLSRFYNQFIAYDLFLDNPLSGVGLGNWILGFNSISLNQFNDFYLYYNILVTVENHNYLTLLLAEQGIISLIFIVPLLYLLGLGIYKHEKLSTIGKGALVSLLVYLLVGTIYRSANSHAFFISKIQLMSMLSLSIIAYELLPFIRVRIYKSSVIVACLTSFVWFSYYNYKISDVNRSMLIKEDLNLSEVDLNKIYNPTFFNHFMQKKSLFLIYAENQLNNNDSIALKYYKLALDDSPNNPMINQRIAILSLKEEDYLTSEYYCKKLMETEEDYIEYQLILAEIYNKYYEDYDKSDDMLDSILASSNYIKPYIPFINFLRAENHIRYRNCILDTVTLQKKSELKRRLESVEYKRQRYYSGYNNLNKLSLLYLNACQDICIEKKSIN